MDDPHGRFSLLGLMLIIALIALGTAAMRVASDSWASLAFSLAIAWAGFGVLGALADGGPRRSPWIGSVVTTGGYLLLAFGPWCSTEVRPHLLTTTMLDWAYPHLHGQPALPRGISRPMLHVLGLSNGGGPSVTLESADHFLEIRGANIQANHERIGHSLASIGCGLVGLFSVRLMARHRAKPDRATS